MYIPDECRPPLLMLIYDRAVFCRRMIFLACKLTDVNAAAYWTQECVLMMRAELGAIS